MRLEGLHESFDESMRLVGCTRTPHHRHDATTKRMNSSASKIMIGKDEDNDIVRLAMVQFCKMCSESAFEDV